MSRHGGQKLENQDFLLIGEASRILEVSDETVRRFAENGQLRFLRAGKYRLFRRDEVERLAAERAKEREAPEA